MVNMVPQTVFGRPLHMQAHDACQQQMYAQAAYGQQTQSPYGQPLYYAPPMTPAPAAGSNSLARSDQSFMVSPAQPMTPAPAAGSSSLACSVLGKTEQYLSYKKKVFRV